MSLRVVNTEAEDFRARVVIPLPSLPVATAGDGPRPMVDMVVPAYNEERNLHAGILRLHAYLTHDFPFTARITIADNASSDATPAIAARLAAELPDVRVLRLNESSRARALAAAWLTSNARVVTRMDLDLQARLSRLSSVLSPIIFGRSEISIGRLQVRVNAMRADIARRLLPEVVNRGWFFETELLLRARRAGFRITS